ncbi:hypothetical protein MHYP_G00343710 [Metynnis hypsauchen]
MISASAAASVMSILRPCSIYFGKLREKRKGGDGRGSAEFNISSPPKPRRNACSSPSPEITLHVQLFWNSAV